MKFTNKVYDVVKWIVVIALPAIAAAYSALGGVWNFPYAEQVVTTINILATFLGALICVSTVNYNKDEKKKEKDKEAT